MSARALAVLAAVTITGALVLAPYASATTAAASPAEPAAAVPAVSRLDGSCSFTGPIKPTLPITVVPKSGARFSFSGKGTCDGHLDGRPLAAAAVTVTFDNVQTVFDTCEFGPDVNLPGKLTIANSHFDVTVDLARLVLAGPLRITTSGGGLGEGSAQFQPGDASAAPSQCASTGLDNASLSASFTTLSPLVGEIRPAATTSPTRGGSGTAPSRTPGHAAKPGHRSHRRHRRARHHHTAARHRSARHRRPADSA